MAKAKEAGAKEYALIRMLGLHGLRVSEVCNLDVEHLEQYEGSVLAHLNRKGGRAQAMPLTSRTAWAIEKLLDGRETGPVFLSNMGNRMDKKAASRIVKRIALAAGITKRMHPHCLRHGFVTIARGAGVPDREVLAATGHKDGRMLSYYDRGSKIELARNATSSVDAFVERAL